MKKFLILLSLFLSNCAWLNQQIAPVFPDSDNFLNRFPINRKGVVILKINSDYPTTYWCKNDEQCITIKSAKTYQIFMADEGLYRLTKHEKTTAIYQENGVDSPLAFEIKENEVRFIDNIDFKTRRKGQDLSFSELKNYFAKQDYRGAKTYFRNYESELKILLKKFHGNDKIVDRYLKQAKVLTKKDLRKSKTRRKKR